MHILTEVWNLILVVAEEVQCSLFLKEEQVMRQVPPDNKHVAVIHKFANGITLQMRTFHVSGFCHEKERDQYNFC